MPAKGWTAGWLTCDTPRREGRLPVGSPVKGETDLRVTAPCCSGVPRRSVVDQHVRGTPMLDADKNE
jgi:hypothetical protein